MAAPPPQAPPQKIPPKVEKVTPLKKKPEFALGQDLQAVEQLIQSQEPENATEENEETSHAPVFQADIEIDYEKFLQTLHGYVQQLHAQNRMNQAVAITEAEHELKGNAWYCKVKNDLSEKLIGQDKDLLPFMRKQLDTPELYMELNISEAELEQKSGIPYTPEEKLKAMAEKNPTLKKLMELFNARIIYK